MAQRQNTKRVDSAAVMGEGSYVVVRQFSYAQVREMQGMQGAEQQMDKALDYTEKLIVECVAEWDWVDDYGRPMPLPSEAGIGALTPDEVAFLMAAIAGTDRTAEKN